MTQKLLLNTQMIWPIFIKILKKYNPNKIGKYWLYLMMWLLICLVIKTLIVTVQLFIRGKN